MNKEQLVSLLEATLSEASDQIPRILIDDDSLLQYGRDWTRFHDPKPLAIVLPSSIEEVQAVVRFARAHSIGLVPSGGRTGLSAAAVAVNGEIVVAFDRMNTVRDFNTIDRTVVCGPGVITEQLQCFAEEQGLFYPVDFASSGSSQLGGNISTNAGGIKVIRYGMTRDWVAGLKVVTGTGELLELNGGLVKNNTGYDLRQLFIGGEGTLGFVVEATMRLARPPQDLTVLMLGAENMNAVMSILENFQQKIDLTAFEFFSEQALSKVIEHSGIPRPFETPTPFYALLEFECTSDAVSDTAMELFEYCMEQGWVLDGVMSQNLSQLENLWRCREDISETISRWTPYKNDISVVVSKVPEFLAEIDSVVSREYPDFEIIWFGHIGDGNLHLNILKPDSLDKGEFLQQCSRVSKWVFEIVQRYGGSVSAEHGVGLLKKDYLTYTRSEVEIELMRGIKKVFDPSGIMNPGKVFDQS
ncbi:FAD-binding oxidoreductase [Parendozoicomonas sp. Alg238-R29]|uniref:FAD-binding oxidoreductase n=1 Tax=Parendozoicomonas sp. Alg238-R29 TaxID=2993446 RepID=UPI00248EAF11|nr:FAD-binding oxidoreductase [Parendozoicomonas sp. Alg238-R29]